MCPQFTLHSKQALCTFLTLSPLRDLHVVSILFQLNWSKKLKAWVINFSSREHWNCISCHKNKKFCPVWNWLERKDWCQSGGNKTRLPNVRSDKASDLTLWSFFFLDAAFQSAVFFQLLYNALPVISVWMNWGKPRNTKLVITLDCNLIQTLPLR